MPPDWNDRTNILCIRLDNMGDVLMSSPAMRALKESHPQRKLTLLTSYMGSTIAPFIPEIDEVIEFNVPWVKLNKADEVSLYELAFTLKQKQFDAAVIFTTFSQNPLPAAMICHLAGIHTVLSYCRENPYDLISNWVPDRAPLDEMPHQVLRDLNLVKTIGAETKDTTIQVSITTDAIDKIQRKLRKKKSNGKKPIILIHPGVSEVKRQYPVDRFAQIAKKLTDRSYQVIISGSAEEKGTAEKILKQDNRIISLVGECSMEEFIALVSQSSVLISNNTGPVHIASAVQTPVVVFYALTNPEHTPWKVKHKAFYFDVPEHLQSKNVLLEYAVNRYMEKTKQLPTTAEVMQTIDVLLKNRSPISDE